MSNFDFLPPEWGDTRADAIRAESYGRLDPRSSVFYARRVLEQVVTRVYDLERLPVPYRADLAAQLGDAGFAAAVGPESSTGRARRWLPRRQPSSPRP